MWGNQFGWGCVVRGSRAPSPGDSGWDLESGKLPKKGWSFRTGFARLGKRSPSGWDPRRTTRGAISSSVIIALLSPETRRLARRPRGRSLPLAAACSAPEKKRPSLTQVCWDPGLVLLRPRMCQGAQDPSTWPCPTKCTAAASRVQGHGKS